MFRPKAMKHVRLLLMRESLPRASLLLAELERFHPDPRPPAEQRLSEQPGRDYRDLFRLAQGRLNKIEQLRPQAETSEQAAGMAPSALTSKPDLSQTPIAGEVQPERLVTLNTWLGNRWTEASEIEERLRRIEEAIRAIHEQQAALENFADLNIDLDTLRDRTRFLDFYVGTLPRENVAQLEGAVKLAGHLLFIYRQEADTANVVVVGPRGEQARQLDSVLSSAGFQALPVPEQGVGRPSEQRARFAERIHQLGQDRQSASQALVRWFEQHHEGLKEAQAQLRLAEPLVTLDPALHGSGPLAVLAGWVPARDLETLRSRLQSALNSPFELEARDPLPEELAFVPSMETRSRLLAPFALLVKQYGVPRYGEADPTPLFALTFILMFGAMFGDIGQGAVIAGLALLFRRKLGRLALFGVLAGTSSVIFGVLYGSVFGYEELLPALWLSPIHHPILMLEIALGFGVVFLTLACLLAIYNRLLVGNRMGALFGHHGLVNLLFYLALVWGALGMANGTGFGLAPLSLVILTLLALAIFNWRQLDSPLSEKILVVAIETLETLIGYVSNTLSFLRVAAFSLNHAALSIAVLTLANAMDTTGHLVTVILGNLFVLVVEGGIVMIQVMRLEYYEGFSRYFSGDGLAFRPLRLRAPGLAGRSTT